MDLAFSQGVTREHIQNGSVTEEQQRQGDKDAQPYRVITQTGQPRRGSSLTDPRRDMLGRRASRLAGFADNGVTHSFLTGC